MIIESEKALRTWLEVRLEPICDADPKALAKYVIALVKKDKSDDDLQSLCIDQLEVFLQGETVSFVNDLFKVVKNQDYLKTPEKNTKSSPKKDDRKHSDDSDLMQKRIDNDKRDDRRNRHDSSSKRNGSPRERSERHRERRSDDREDRRDRRDRDRSRSPRRSPRRRRDRYEDDDYDQDRRESHRSSKRKHRDREDRSRSPPVKEKKKKDKKAKKQCPDFLDKGVCTKGESCKYEHAGAIVTIDNDRATNGNAADDKENSDNAATDAQTAEGQTLTVPATNTESRDRMSNRKFTLF